MTSLEGKYEIIAKLREGGMGAIYKVRHRLLDEIRVVKVMQPQHEQDGSLRARFVHEARTAIKLRHPNIAQMYDFSVDAVGNAFIVMEYIEGITVQDLFGLMDEPNVAIALEIACQALHGLAYLHRRGIVHRDIAPDNLMVTLDDERRPLVKLIDLGLAKVLASESGLTMAGVFLGKLRYSSPEHFHTESAAPISQRSDLYSFGVVLYEMLTRAHPIEGKDTPSLIAGHLLNPPRSFAKSDPKGRIPEDLRRTVLTALAKRPEDRFATAEEFADALAEIQKRFPFPQEEFDLIFARPSATTDRIRVRPPGSSQSLLDKQFKMGATPTPEPVSLASAQTSAIDVSIGLKRLEEAAGRCPHELPVEPGRPMGPDLGALIREAEGLIAIERFTEAKAPLDAVLAHDPTHAGARELLSELERRMTSKTSPALRGAAAAAAEAGIGHLLDAGELDEARAALEAARAAHGESATFSALHRRLEELAVRALQERIDLLRFEARNLVAAGLIDDAVAKLEDAIALAPDDAGLEEAMAEVHELQRLGREEQERGSALTAIGKLLDGSHLDEAGRRADEAAARWGESDELAALRSRIAAAREAEARERKRQTTVMALLVDARSLVDGEQFEAGIARLEQALAISPEDTLVTATLSSVRKAAAKHAKAAKRAAELAAATGEIEHLMELGRLEEAAKSIDEAATAFPDVDVGPWRERLRAALSDRLQARVEVLLNIAARMSEAEEYANAIERLQEAQALDPESPRVAELLAGAREAARHLAEKESREERVRGAVTAVRGCLAREDLLEAERQLVLARRVFGECREFSDLGEELGRRQRQSRADKIEALILNARRIADAGNLERAVSVLREAVALDPDSVRARNALNDALRLEAEATIAAFLDRGDLSGAERALSLAEKLHGAGHFAHLRSRLETLR